MPLAFVAIARAASYHTGDGGPDCHDPSVSGPPLDLVALCESGTQGTSTELVETYTCSQDGVTYDVIQRTYSYWGDVQRWYYSADTLELAARYSCPDYTSHGCACWWSGLQLDRCPNLGPIDCPEPTSPTVDTGDAGRWELTGSMTVPNRGHRAVLLDDGRVLLVGGVAATAETYDPLSGNFTATAPTCVPHGQGLTATLLTDGRVLVVGGLLSRGAAEVFDPATDAWSCTAGAPAYDRTFHTATRLPDGRVLLAGGNEPTLTVLVTAEVFDPDADSFSPAGDLRVDRVGAGDALLADGSVLVVGGWSATAAVTLSSAERYHPAEGRFTSTGSMSVGRSSPSVTALAYGRVLVLGAGTAEIFDGGRFDPVGDLVVSRLGGVGAAPLPDGGVLVTGGYVDIGPVVTETVERFDPGSGSFGPMSPMHVKRQEHTATLLRDGSVLVTGGYDGIAETSTAERYVVPDPAPGAASTVRSDPGRCGCAGGPSGAGLATLLAAAASRRGRGRAQADAS